MVSDGFGRFQMSDNLIPDLFQISDNPLPDLFQMSDDMLPDLFQMSDDMLSTEVWTDEDQEGALDRGRWLADVSLPLLATALEDVSFWRCVLRQNRSACIFHLRVP